MNRSAKTPSSRARTAANQITQALTYLENADSKGMTLAFEGDHELYKRAVAQLERLLEILEGVESQQPLQARSEPT